MESWYVVPLLLSTGLVGCGRLVNMRLLRGELGFELVDERHWQVWYQKSTRVRVLLMSRSTMYVIGRKVRLSRA